MIQHIQNAITCHLHLDAGNLTGRKTLDVKNETFGPICIGALAQPFT